MYVHVFLYLFMHSFFLCWVIVFADVFALGSLNNSELEMPLSLQHGFWKSRRWRRRSILNPDSASQHQSLVGQICSPDAAGPSFHKSTRYVPLEEVHSLVVMVWLDEKSETSTADGLTQPTEGRATRPLPLLALPTSRESERRKREQTQSGS